MIAHPQRLIFVHIPKCAGMSVEAALGGLPHRQIPEQHLSGALIRRYYPEEWEAYHKFAVVRHPVARCWSYTRFYRRYDPVWRRHLGAVDDGTLLRDLMFGRTNLGRYAAHPMLTGEEEVLRFEDLRSEWPAFARRNGLPVELPHRNRSPDRAPDPPPLMVWLTAVMFPEDYDRFGYERPDPARADLSIEDRGTLCWAELHAWAHRLPERWTTEAARAAEAWLASWRARLPDPSWMARLDALLAERPPVLTGAAEVRLWAERLHDDVNRALGKPLWEPWSP